MLKNLCYLNLLLLAACAEKPLDIKTVVAPSAQTGGTGSGELNSDKKATIEIVHPAAIGDQLKAFGRSSTKISFELIKTVSYAQKGDAGQSGAAKVRSAVVDDFGPLKVTRIENINPGTYSHLSVWVDYLNEAASYSGKALNEGVTLKAGEVLRLTPKFLSYAEAECGGEDSSPRITFYASTRGANCKKPPIDPQNNACIELAKPHAPSCFITAVNKRCSAKASDQLYEITATTEKCSDPDIELVRKLCYENVSITREELTARECVDIP